MRFDPSKWSELKLDHNYKADEGRVHVRASAPVVVYAVDADGIEAILGTGVDVNVQCQGVAEVRCESSDAALQPRVFLFARHAVLHVPVGPSFTNVDRQPHESGAYSSITARLRLAERNIMRRLRDRAEREAVRAQARASREREPDPAPVVETPQSETESAPPAE